MLQKICLSLLITLLLAGCMNSNGDGDSHKPKQEQPTNAESSNDQESEDQTATEEHEDQTATNPSSTRIKRRIIPGGVIPFRNMKKI
ncbi:hypothetical protein ACFQ5F_00870 [Kroppenstedtia eburnea]|uniref:hypothetical protein n=1 Tax=Kroppenstedtia eburnea TaxID=714067 RepID=UPI0009712E51|nr:hypothetical protein [Kroppenstedtia eburnea]QKI81679.1 hypothetical protein GXN75_06540 [Kroppenstedtia eburnea]